MTSERRSSSTRRRSFPKFARARSAETTIVPFLLKGLLVATKSPFRTFKLYSSKSGQSSETAFENGIECGPHRMSNSPVSRVAGSFKTAGRVKMYDGLALRCEAGKVTTCAP